MCQLITVFVGNNLVYTINIYEMVISLVRIL